MKRKICVVTGTRAEYGLLYWLMKEIEANKDLELQLIVTGMHLSPEFGLTYKEIEKDFKIKIFDSNKKEVEAKLIEVKFSNKQYLYSDNRFNKVKEYFLELRIFWRSWERDHIANIRHSCYKKHQSF